jgi:hypothetical protein
MGSHRLAIDGGGAGTQASPAQQSGPFSHVSPSCPHIEAAGRQVPGLASPAPSHTPEQQSAPAPHSSHSTLQPPRGAHRLTLSAPMAQLLEQQSAPVMQISPARCVHIM